MAKNSKNLQKVQDMLDGNNTGKLQVGMHITEDVHANRKVGDKWTDSDGNEWEQKQGYRSKVSKLAARGIFDATCKTCEKGILKPWDKDVHKADGRCYHCQTNYELDLKFDKPIRWFAYRRLRDLRNMDAILEDMEKYIFEKHKFEKNEKVFDKSVANALANGEVEMSVKKNIQ